MVNSSVGTELNSKKLNFTEIIKQSDELVPSPNCLGGCAGIISFKDEIINFVNDFYILVPIGCSEVGDNNRLGALCRVNSEKYIFRINGTRQSKYSCRVLLLYRKK